MRCVVFDLDGTLADTSADLIAAANACFRDLGMGDVLDPAADAATAFRGGRAMLRAGLERVAGTIDERIVEAQYPRLLQAYGAALDVHTRLYPGVEAALDRLAGAGYRLAVCTNKPADLAERLLVRLGVRGMFGAMIGADTLPVRKPRPEPLWEAIDRAGGARGRALLVGDTVTDRDAARNAGVPCVLVTFGPEGEAVATLEPEALLEHYDHLEGLVGALIG